MFKKTLLAFCAALSTVGLLSAQTEIATQNTSLWITAEKGKAAKLLYYGVKTSNYSDIANSGSALHTDLYPAYGIQCKNEYAIQATHTDGNMSLDMVVEEISQTNTENEQLVTLLLKDKVYPFQVKLFFKAHKHSDVIETWTEISHQEKGNVMLYKFFSGALQLPVEKYWLTQFNGGWAHENYMSELRLNRGTKLISNKEGVRNGWTDNPSFMISIGSAPLENKGNVIGGTLAYLGNYKFIFNIYQDLRLNIIAGINEEASFYSLAKGETFSTPPFLYTYSTRGKGQVSRNFHRWALNNGGLYNGQKSRDILLNSWEGVYFDVNQEVMNDMMRDFAALGGELFVMDDGWFGDKYPRNNDQSSLGDWGVAKGKLPQGIEGLTQAAKNHKIKFGIWIEPEMANVQSELFEKHPDWIIQQPGRDIAKGRGGGQMMLDLSNPKVQQHVFNVVDNLLTHHPDIAYIKWDANHNITNQGSTYLPKDKQSHLYIEYHRGLQTVLERIRAKYPDVVLQACAAGGGRINYGALRYFDEYWTSDNTDALQRLYMQWSVLHFYPALGMGSHVSASPNHQTGREIPLKFRFDVAMTGRLGMELLPSKMTDKEKEFTRKSIACYKQIRPIIQQGDLYRLLSPYENEGNTSMIFVTKDQTQALFFAYHPRAKTGETLAPYTMDGLDPNASYRLKEVNFEGDKPRFGGEKTIISGKFLMMQGLNLPLRGEYKSMIIHLEKIN